MSVQPFFLSGGGIRPLMPEIVDGRGAFVDIHLPDGDISEILAHPLVKGLLELAADGAVVIDAASRQVLATNARARDLLGLREEVRGSCCHETLRSATCQESCPLSRALAGLPPEEVVTLLLHRHDDGPAVHADARALVLRDGQGRPVALIELLRGRPPAAGAAPVEAAALEGPVAAANLAETERQAIHRALEQARGNHSAAARLLGIDRSTLWRKLKRLEAGAV